MTRSGDTTPGAATGSTDAVELWIEHCRLLAGSTLDSVETPADELLALAAGNRQLMEEARKVILAALGQAPGDPTWSQMLAFWRRAFEKGSWSWEQSPWDRSPFMT